MSFFGEISSIILFQILGNSDDYVCFELVGFYFLDLVINPYKRFVMDIALLTLDFTSGTQIILVFPSL